MQRDTARGRKPVVSLRGPAELLAAVPGLLGYVPEESVVLIAVGPAGRHVTQCVRCDIPPPSQVSVTADQLAAATAEARPSFVDVVIVGGGSLGPRGSPPRRDVAEAIRCSFGVRGVAQPGAFWVSKLAAGQRWQSYDHPEVGGELPDPAGSLLSAELAGLGHVTFGSRSEMVALFRPDAEETLRRRSELIDQRIGKLAEWTPEVGARDVVRAVRLSAEPDMSLSDEDVADLAVALSDARIRDACLAMAVPPNSSLAHQAARLWQFLARALPAPERAEAACLAAYAAYQGGDGTLARIALDTALASNPGHVLAGLLDHALQRGFHPHRLRALAEHDEMGLCARLRAAS